MNEGKKKVKEISY